VGASSCGTSPPRDDVGATALARATCWSRKTDKLVQGYLVDKKTPAPRTLQQGYAYGPMVVLDGWLFSYERGNPVRENLCARFVGGNP